MPVKLPKSPELRGLEGPEPQLQGERPGHRCGRRLERVQRPQRRPEVQQGASEAFFLQRFLGCNAGSYGSTFMCFLHIMFFFETHGLLMIILYTTPFNTLGLIRVYHENPEPPSTEQYIAHMS